MATVSSDMSASPWASSLPDDLVRLLASRLLAGDLRDYVRFRAVCGAWRSATASPRGRGVVDPRFHPRRWMMLSEGDGLYPGHPELHGYVRFFNLDTGAFVRAHIPLFDDHCILDSFDGILVLQRDHDTAVRLLHPFTGDLVDLPPLSTLLPQIIYPKELPRQIARSLEWKKLTNLRSFSTAATFADGVVTVTLAFDRIHRVAIATPQDHQWTLSTWYYPLSIKPFSYQGKTYIAEESYAANTADIFQIDTPLPGEVLQPPKLIATTSTIEKQKLYSPIRFVECNSEVLVVGYSDKLSSKRRVYRLTDVVMGKYIPMTSIGGKAIFLYNRTLSVSAKALPTVIGETIISGHPYHGFVQYHISTGIWSQAMDECSSKGIEAGPCSLILHIYTCCNCKHWNKGLLSRREKYGVGWLRWPVKWKLRQGA